MLTWDDGELVARDRALPGLATLLDGEALGELLADYLTPPGGVRVEYLRYKPGTSLSCGLLLDTPLGVVRGFGVAGSADFAAKLPKLTGLHRRGLHRPLASDARQHVVVSTMENDPALRGLHDGMRAVRHALPDRLAEGRLRVVRYRPLRRAVAIAEVEGSAAAVVRVVEPGAVEAHLRRLRAAVAEQLPVPREIAHNRRRGVIATAHVHGTVSADGTLDHETQALAGAVLADWHARQPPAGRMRLPEPGVLDSLEATAALVGHLVPDLADDVASLARSVKARLMTAGDGRRCLVHGDFSVDQLVRTSTQVTVLDLDRLRRDAPEWDAATWFAAEVLTGHAVPGDDPADVLAPLLASYREAGGVDLRPDLPLYAAAALLLRAGEPFRLRQQSWSQRVQEIVRAAAGLAAVTA